MKPNYKAKYSPTQHVHIFKESDTIIAYSEWITLSRVLLLSDHDIIYLLLSLRSTLSALWVVSPNNGHGILFFTCASDHGFNY